MRVWLVGIAALLLVALGGTGATASPPDPETGRYIVVLKDSVDHPGNVAARHEDNRGADTKHVFRHALNGYSATMSKADVEALRRDPTVEYIVRSRRVHASAQEVATGVRRVFASQNPTLDVDGRDDVQVNADVAVLDTGIDYDHPDLRVVARTNCSTAQGDPPHICIDNAGDDGDGHGTHVAGIVGALDNGVGTVGVAPGARLWAVKVLDDDGSGHSDEVVAGIDWITARAGQIEVANMSLGGIADAELDRPEHEAIAKAVDAGIVVVVAAGNDQVNAREDSPANHEDVITVSALFDVDGLPGGLAGYKTCHTTYEGADSDVDDSLAWYSNWGPVVDMIAPGTCIRSTFKNGGYAVMSGTSQAAPHVAGAAAILAAKKNPNSEGDVDQIKVDLYGQGNTNWVQDWNSGNHDAQDSVKEPLLDVSNANVFKNPHPGNVVELGVTSNTASAMQLFATTETGQIAAKDYNPFANPSGWQPWGDGVSLPTDGAGKPIPINGRPAVISRSTATRDIFVKGTNNYLYFRHWDSNLGSWTSWFPMSTPNGQPVTSSPAAVRNPGIKDALSVVVRGNNGAVYMQNYDPSYGWSQWIEVGQPPGGAASSPAITVHNWNTYQVFVVGGDGALWQRAWSPSGWSAWTSLGGILTSAPATYVTNGQKDLWVFARGTDNAIWWRRWSPSQNYTWTAWQSLGGSWISAPVVTSRDDTGVDVFAVGQDGKAQHRRFLYGTWTKWMRVDDDCPPGAC